MRTLKSFLQHLVDEQQVGIRKPNVYRSRKDILNLYHVAELIKGYRLDH